VVLGEELSILESCFFETNTEKFSLITVQIKKICWHPGGNLLQSSLEVGDIWVKVTRWM